MGLLSDPEYGSVKWVRILKKVHRPLCFLCYAVALVWFVMLANRDFNNETYFSENALLPGLVTNEFNGEYAAKQYLTEFEQELEEKYYDTEKIPVPWLVAKMSQLHLEVYTHNYTLNYPLGQGQIYKGTNVYGILRAARTPSLEALVVSAPFRPLSSHQKSTAAGIALMLAFAEFARPQKYWAKDIIFLVTEHEQLGMQAWLEAYHGLQSDSETFYTTLGSFWKPGSFGLDLTNFFPGFDWLGSHKKCLNPGQLKARSGAIQAAINLEFHSPKIKYVEVKVEGLNGQLPNLDLVNLVHKLCVKSGIHHSYKNSYSWVRNRNKVDDWVNNIWTMVGMVSTQLAGVPNGNHGLFHRFGIEAVTLEGRDSSDGPAPRVHSLSAANFHRLGLALETVLRSLNNLLEAFHQSYFFYMLPATDRFVSIGQYMPSLCLMCAAMLLRALALWVGVQPTQERSSQAEDPVDSEAKEPGERPPERLSESSNQRVHNRKTIKEKHSDSESEIPGEQDVKEVVQSSDERVANSQTQLNFSMVNVGANYLLVHVLGYAAMNSPVLFTQLGAKYFSLPSEVSVYYGLCVTSAVLVVAAPALPRLLRRGALTYEELTLVNILVLIELSTLCLALGMHNFPLGLAVAALYTPVALLSGVVVRERGWISVWLQRAACAVLQPLGALTAAMCVYSVAVYGGAEGAAAAAGRGRDAAMQAVMFAVADSLIYGNWVFNVAASVLLPVWVVLWQIVCNSVEGPPPARR